MLKMTIDGEEVVSKNNFTIKEEMLSPSSTILNNTYPKTWEDDKDYTSRFYYPKDYAKLDIQNFSITPEEAGTTIDIVGSATLTDVDTTKESRVLRLLGQTSQDGTPTPSSPIPVNVVSGDNEINICGKNLFNPSNVILNREISSGVIAYSSNSNMYYMQVKIGTTYNFSRKSSTYSGFIGFSDEIPITGVTTYDRTNLTNITNVSKTATHKYLILQLRQVEDLSETMVEVGSTKTTYEPYIGNTYPIYLGVENLFDISTVDNNHVLASDGSLTYTLNFCVSDFIAVQPNTQYTISYIYDSTASGAEDLMRVGYYDSSKTFKTRPTSNSKPWVITTPSDCYFIRISYQKNSHSNVQVEIGGKQNSYSAYGTTPIELCKIGTYQDYIYKDNGSWYLHKEIGKVVLDGSQDVYENGTTTNNINFHIFVDDGKSIQNTSTENLTRANYFLGSQTNTTINSSTANLICLISNSRIYIVCQKSDFANTSAFKTWLSTHNTIVYYVLNAPTTTEITDTTLLEQLDALESQ